MNPRTTDSSLHRLLARQRRRWIAIRAVESAAIGAIVGAGACVPLVAALWWHERSSVEAVAVILLLASSLGAVLSLLRTPGAAATAYRLDAQHRLGELFSTALAIHERDDPAMADIVRVLADDAAGRIADRPLAIARFGGRSYAAVVMTASMTLAFSSIASQPTQDSTPRAGRATDARLRQPAGDVPTRHPTGAARSGERDHALGAIFARPTDDANNARSVASSVPPADSDDRPSTGTGAARGNSDSSTQTPFPIARSSDVPEPSTTGGNTAASGPRAELHAGESKPGGVIETRPTDPARATSPPTVGQESAGPESTPGGIATRRDGVPERYRGLVRAYFRRE